MTDAASQHTCGACKHGCTASMNLADPIECRRFPPTTQFFVAPNGNLMQNTAYPKVQRLSPPCGEYAPKFAMQN